MLLEIVGISISLPTLLSQTAQGVRKPLNIRRALKEIPGLLDDLSATIEDAENRNERLKSRDFNPSPLKELCLRNTQKLEEIKAAKDKIHREMNGKWWTTPKRMMSSPLVKQQLDQKKNQVEQLIDNIQGHHLLVHVGRAVRSPEYRTPSSVSSIPDLSTASRTCLFSVKAIILRYEGVWGIACRVGNFPECLDMLQVSARSGDKHAVIDLAAISNLQLPLVPSVDRSQSAVLLEQVGGQSKQWKCFTDGILRLNAMGKYREKVHETFDCFASVVNCRNCELRGKAAYYAGFCHRFPNYGAPSDSNQAVRFMEIGAEGGVFYAFVDLAATYKHGFGVDRNLEMYSELVQTMEERGGAMNAQVEEAAYRFQQDRYSSPFHGCDIDCMYKGFCYLNGICVEVDMRRGLKLVRKSANKGHLLARKIITDISGSDEYCTVH